MKHAARMMGLLYVFVASMTLYGDEASADNNTRTVIVPNQPAEILDPSVQSDGATIEVADEDQSWLPENVILVPVPSREPIFGWGLDVMGGMFLDLDKEHPDTPPSSAGALVSYSQNDTWVTGLAGNFNLFGDKLRAETAIFYANINYRFWGIGSDAGSQDAFADISQKIPMFYASAKYRIFRSTYLGLGYIGGKAETTIDLNGLDLPPGFDKIEDTIQIGAIDIPFQYDTRDNQMYPRDGWLVDANAILYRKSVGSDFDSESYSIGANRYISLRDRDVLAFRGWTSYTAENAPFYLQSSVGGRQDMRGYEYGRYTDRTAYTLQS